MKSPSKAECEAQCKGIRLGYEPLKGCKVSVCLQCGYVYAELNGKIVYETYEPAPILIGFSARIIEALKNVIRGSN